MSKHIMVDISNIQNKKDLCSLDYVVNFLSDMEVVLGGYIEFPKIIPYFNGKIPEDSGITAVSFLNSGGHLTIHTFDQKKFAFLDIFTLNSTPNIKDKIMHYLSKKFPGASLVNSFSVLKGGTQGFGPHYIATGFVDNRFGMTECYNFLESIVKTVSMTPISKPKIIKSNNLLAGIIIIAESHVAIYKENNKFFLDIFSCKDFDISMLNDLLNKNLNITSSDIYVRGLGFPR